MKKVFFYFLLSVFVGCASRSHQNLKDKNETTPREQKNKLDAFSIENYSLLGAPQDTFLMGDTFLLGERYQYGGEDLFAQFIKFLFPITGREKRTMFLPNAYWGEKKPQYRKFNWKEFETNHFVFYAYPDGYETLKKVIRFVEDDYERNNEIFGVGHLFTKKIPVIFYQSRRDFEQTYIVGGPIPEGLGGVTEIFAWKRAVFPFEGDLSKLEHVVKHESTHIYQIAKGGERNLPLWFIEGNAETNSVYWDADADMILRDAYLNSLFLPINELWRIQGSYLMYKFGNFICNYIWDEFGVDGFRKIYDKAKDLNFEDNLKQSLGITIEELDRRVQERLSRRYGHILRKEPDLIDTSKKLKERQFLMASHQSFYLSGGAQGPRLGIFVNYIHPNGDVTSEKVVTDRRFRNDSLSYFRKGAFINDKWIAYSIKRAERDELRLLPYTWDEKRKRFRLGKTKNFSWPNIEGIERPVILEDGSVGFIGYEKGYSAIYVTDASGKSYKKIFGNGEHLSHLDYSPARKAFVFSREDERLPNRIRYDRNLYLLDYPKLTLTQLTNTKEIIEEQPRFSLSGNYVMYIADPSGTNDLHLLNLQSMQSRQMTNLKVGARNPHWGPEGSILLNGFKEFMPTIHQAAFPSPQDVLQAGLPKGPDIPVRVTDKGFILETAPPKPVEKAAPPAKPFYIEDQKLWLNFGQKKYQATRVATVDGAMVVHAKGKDTTSIISSDDFFTLEKNELQSLRSTMVAGEEIPANILQEITQRLDARPILRKWWDPVRKQAVLLVNNRLASDAKKFEEKEDLSVIRVDENYKIEDLGELDFDNFKRSIQWLSFLKDGKVFMAIAEKKEGPFDIYIFERNSQRAFLASDSCHEFRVSSDGAFYALREDSTLNLYNSQSLKRVWGAKDLSKPYAFHFLDKSSKFWLVNKQDTEVITQEIEGTTGEVTTYPKYKIRDANLMFIALDELNARILLLTEPKNDSKLPQKLTLLNPRDQTVYDLSKVTQALKFEGIRFRRGFLFFEEIFSDFQPSQTIVWRNQSRDSLDGLKKIVEATPDIWVLESSQKLAAYRPVEGRSAFISGETFGFAILGSKIIYSAPYDDQFQLFYYDLQTEDFDRYLETQGDAISPVVQNNQVSYIEKKRGHWDVSPNPMGQAPSEIMEVTSLGTDKEGLVASAVKITPPLYQGPRLLPPQSFAADLVGVDADIPFRLQNVAAAAAYDGSSFRFFVSGYLDNLFSDQGVYVNAIFLGGSRFATVSYVDLRNGWNHSVFFNDRDDVRNYGLGSTKVFTLDRQREINIYGNYEIQEYGSPTPNTLRFVTPEVANKTLHLLKTGAIYAYDVTIWDRHGPVSGSRFMAHTEAGYDMSFNRLANVDFNIDWRMYNSILPRFGLAHRLVAGTSQGDVPSIFLVGGNISFRGAGFDDLDGQNFWVFSEDVRIPLLDFVGAKFFDPVDQFLGFFTRFFDVRTGWFVDVGSVWYNSDPVDVDYATGYFANVPTLLGINFRFHQSLFGKKNIGFWIGTNW